jgi:hypothetical protein
MSNDKITISLQINRALYEKIQKSSEEEGLSISAFIRRLLLKYFN